MLLLTIYWVYTWHARETKKATYNSNSPWEIQQDCDVEASNHHAVLPGAWMWCLERLQLYQPMMPTSKTGKDEWHSWISSSWCKRSLCNTMTVQDTNFKTQTIILITTDQSIIRQMINCLLLSLPPLHFPCWEGHNFERDAELQWESCFMNQSTKPV